MFLRIYGTIAIAILVALAISVSIYNFSYSKRLTSYSEAILYGSMEIVSKGYQRQSDSKKHRWLKLIAQITGLNISAVETAPKEEDASKKNEWRIQANEEIIEADFFESNNRFEVYVDQIGEQQLRGIALLMVNELALVSNANKQALIKELGKNFPFKVKLQDSKSVHFELDNQQRQLFESGNVVVFNNDHANQTVAVKVGGRSVLSIGPIEAFEPLTLELLLLLLLINLIITSMTTYWVIRKLELRMGRINKAVSEFGPANTDVKVPVEGNDVIAVLSKKVNDMTGRIQELLTHQKEITQAVSHELRTPIARIKFRLELLNEELDELGVDKTSPISEKLNGVERDLKELEDLVGEILILHKLDSDQKNYAESLFELSPIISEKIRDFGLNNSNINFELIEADDTRIVANKKDVNRLLDNIIGNACKHAKSQVSVTLRDELVTTRISVEDDGQGISVENRNKVFQPFTQIKDSKNQQVSGYGLGLAIVKRIASLNRLEVTVEESRYGGARFDIVCPKPNQYDEFQASLEEVDISDGTEYSSNSAQEVAQ